LLPTSNHDQASAERDAEIDRLKQAAIERDKQIAELEQNLAECDKKIASQTAEIDALRRSTSWRLTAPLREPKTQLLRIHTLTSLIRRSVKARGGVTAILSKVVQLYREGGLAALRAKIQWLRSGPTGSIDRKLYSQWIERYDTLDDRLRTAIRRRIAAFNHAPLISVVMPTYNPQPEWLAEAIESVRNQLYPNWELCIADDVSTDPAIRTLLEKYARDDKRIKVVFREQNGHISAASNSGLQIASGEWVALLDHDDLLPEHALYCVADAILANPAIRLIYSDEDKIDEDGQRHDPYFKCDWNPDLFYSQNMFSHLGVYYKPLLDQIGGFRLGLEGSQDYDLALRCLEHIEAQAIHHIPRVLYHWRVHAASTAADAGAKPYAALAGERALNEHFAKQDMACHAESLGFGYRVRYDLPEALPLVSLIIPTRNGLQLMRQCITSILDKTTYTNYEIIIVDNGSDDPEALRYFKSLSNDARIRVLRDDSPFNYSALNNAAVLQARGELIGLVNNDIEVISADWLSEMVSLAVQPAIGAVGAKLLYPDNTLQHGGVVLGLGGVAGHAGKHALQPNHGYFGRTSLISSFSAVTAACLVMRKAVYLEVGGLNEKDLTIAFNDVDFCIRVREAGYRNVWTPYAELYHHESATRGIEDNPQKQARFDAEVEYMQRQWVDLLTSDPAYSPNLTLEYDGVGLAWPPRVKSLV